ncbi:MAG: lactate dehydrogenase [Acidobacteria bacterium]|nr:lactate dehydrogenase [Acidobacteriota bacterium]
MSTALEPSVAIVGAAGACGRQLAVAMLERRMLPPEGRLQLIGHRGGASEHELHGLRADLRDAFADHAPTIELGYEPSELDADIVVMLAGATLSTDPHAPADRVTLARTNRAVFATYADELAGRSGASPLVLVQSNPVELGVEVFARTLDRHRVVGVGAHSDTMRFRRELADSHGVDRSQVTALVLGQHGDHLVPLWSGIDIDGLTADAQRAAIDTHRAGRSLLDLPTEIVEHRGQLLGLVADGRVHEAFAHVAGLAPDLRAALKPFLVHFTAGHTTEIVTAHAVAEVLEIALGDRTSVLALQVLLAGEFHDLAGVTAVPVRFGAEGWTDPVDPGLAADELDLLRLANRRIAEANAAALTGD